jgi:hypothetical protein
MKLHGTLCSLDKDDIKANIGDISGIVSGAKYICRRCARGASKKKYLCKPAKLKGKA